MLTSQNFGSVSLFSIFNFSRYAFTGFTKFKIATVLTLSFLFEGFCKRNGEKRCFHHFLYKNPKTRKIYKKKTR